jgi:hypothetical protein
MDDDLGTFTGYGSIFGAVDSYGDVVEKGAFKKSIREKGQFPLLWSHDIQTPVGVVKAKEDSTGLRVEGQLNLDVQRAKEIRSLMKQGAIAGLSIGYQTLREDKGEVDKKPVRLLKEIALWEISPVVFGACPGALVSAVKSEAIEEEETPALTEEPTVTVTPEAEPQPISKPEQRLHLLDQLRLKF